MSTDARMCDDVRGLWTAPGGRVSTDIYIVFGVLAVTVALFVSDRMRLDLVALLAMLALLLGGVLEPKDGLRGFSDPIVLMIAGLFVVGGGLAQTGVAERLGRWLGRVAGTSEVRLIAVIMIVTAVLSAFMSSTGTVAVMLPVVVTLARSANIAPSRLLMPLAFASLLGGMLTLIGTPPNIVVSNQLSSQGLEPFGFFAFSPVGLVMLVVGIGFMLTVGRRLLPGQGGDAAPASTVGRRPQQLSGSELVGDYELEDNILQFRLVPGSDLVGKTLAEADLRTRFQGTVLDVRPAKDGGEGPSSRVLRPDTVLAVGDLLSVAVSEEALDEVKEREAKLLVAELAEGAPLPAGSLLVEVLLPPRSSLIGRTLKDRLFRDKYRANVLSIRRAGKLLQGNPADELLRFGDTLLVEARRRDVEVLRSESRDFVVIAEPRELAEPWHDSRRAPVAIAILVGMLVLMTAGIVPHVTAVLLAAVAMVLSRCLTMTEAYRSINWESVVLIAAILPMATALDRTGGLRLIVGGLTSALGGSGPIVLMAALFLITSLFSQVISNTATTVLLAPVAYQVAVDLGASPRAFLMAVAVAASTAFATPIASPVNTLVLGPAGYRFADFLKVGVLLQLLILGATLLIVPWLF